MNKEPESPKRGRPKLANPSNQTLGRVRVTQGQIDAYTEAATSKDESLSDWVRRNLDRVAKRDMKD